MGGGSYSVAYVNDGEGAWVLREPLCPFALKAGAVERKDLDGPAAAETACLMSFLSRGAGPDQSLSVATVLMESSRSSMLLLRLRLLVEANPDTRLCVDEPALMSLSFSFS